MYIGKEIEEITDMLNLILKDFEAWRNRNRFRVHTGKTEAMLISGVPVVGPLKPLMLGEDCINFTTISTIVPYWLIYHLSKPGLNN